MERKYSIAKKITFKQAPTHNGCFTTCLAMLLDIDYNKAYSLVKPNNDPSYTEDHYNKHILEKDKHMVSPDYAFKVMKKLGINPRESKTKNIYSLKKTALIWICWDTCPELMHSVVYDGNKKLFWCPDHEQPLNYLQRNNVQRMVYKIINVG